METEPSPKRDPGLVLEKLEEKLRETPTYKRKRSAFPS
jgi:hypothetical protein